MRARVLVCVRRGCGSSPCLKLATTEAGLAFCSRRCDWRQFEGRVQEDRLQHGSYLENCDSNTGGWYRCVS